MLYGPLRPGEKTREMRTSDERTTRLATPVERTKLVPPRVGMGWVSRPRLLRVLTGSAGARLLLVDAPVGYGKSSLLAGWRAAEDGRRYFAWVSLDEADSDPMRMLTHLLAAIRTGVDDFGTEIVPLLRATGAASPDVVLRRLLDELNDVPAPMVIVLDDYHRLPGNVSRDLMGDLVMNAPTTTQVAIATRADPPLPLGRLRAMGSLTEIRAADLRFDGSEATRLLEASGVSLSAAEVTSLVERTEGWPAGLYLAALSLRSEPDPSTFVSRFAGTHRHVADYLSEEVLQREPDATRAFLVRSSVLDRMCGALCDAVLGTTGSQAILEELEHSNLFIVPLDDDRTWYRYHHLFGEMLRAELARTDPALAARIRAAASGWFEAQGLHEDAIRHAISAGDSTLAGDLIARHWPSLFRAGRLETVRQWLRALGDDAIEMHPAAALTAGWVAALRGEPEAMERWLLAVEKHSDGEGPVDDSSSLEAGVATVRGLFGFHGLNARHRDLTRARELEPHGSRWDPLRLWGLGHVALLSGDPSAAKRRLEDALRLTSPQDGITQIMGLSYLSIVETELGRSDTGIELARRAETVARESGLTADPRGSGIPLAIGLAAAATGDLVAAQDAMERALIMRRSAGRLSPWATLDVLLPLAPIRFMRGDTPGAEELLDEARTLLAELEDAGDLPRRLEETERLLRRSGRDSGFGETLTDREMAVLRMMPSDLSLREIGVQLYLSLNTVKTHSRAIYRKLGVSSRAGAVDRAKDLQLL
jgi:LuxR family transcriptional regulator, maltose regulon positive regulatory protein